MNEIIAQLLWNGFVTRALFVLVFLGLTVIYVLELSKEALEGIRKELLLDSSVGRLFLGHK